MSYAHPDTKHVLRMCTVAGCLGYINSLILCMLHVMKVRSTIWQPACWHISYTTAWFWGGAMSGFLRCKSCFRHKASTKKSKTTRGWMNQGQGLVDERSLAAYSLTTSNQNVFFRNGHQPVYWARATTTTSNWNRNMPIDAFIFVSSHRRSGLCFVVSVRLKNVELRSSLMVHFFTWKAKGCRRY